MHLLAKGVCSWSLQLDKVQVCSQPSQLAGSEPSMERPQARPSGLGSGGRFEAFRGALSGEVPRIRGLSGRTLQSSMLQVNV